MFALPKKIYDHIESWKGRKLFFTLSIILISFTALGISIGYFTNKNLRNSEAEALYKKAQQQLNKDVVSYEGKVVYVNPSLYPGENISYVLVDTQGKDLVLLRASDARLTVTENLIVKASGSLNKTLKDKKAVLEVSSLIIKNVTN